MRHFPLRELAYAIGFVVLLAAIYVASYHATVQRWKVLDSSLKGWRPVVMYRFANEQSHWFFGPIHAVDREVRPTYWEDEVID